MSGLEALTVIAAVAALVSAYKDGGDVLDRLKNRRRRRQAALPNPALEETIHAATQSIEGEKEHGLARFGEEWYDDEAVAQLVQIELRFYRSAFPEFKRALEDDEFNDFSGIINHVDLGKYEALEALHQAFRRRVSGSQASASASRLQERYEPRASPKQEDTRGPSTVKETQGTHAEDEPGIVIPPPYPGLPGRERQRREGFSPRTQEPSKDSTGGSSQNKPTSRRSSRALPPLPTSTRRKAQSTPVILTQRTAKQVALPPQTESAIESVDDHIYNSASVWQDEGNHRRSDSLYLSHSEDGASSTRSISSAGASHKIVPPDESNQYHGLCPGAVMLQAGLQDAMRSATDVRFIMSDVKFETCQRCAFTRQIEKHAVWPVPECSLQFRWTFLAKCHAPVVRAEQEEYVYHCIFCALTGRPLERFEGTDMFMLHVATHRNEAFGQGLLHRVNCVTDRLASPSDLSWDLNFVPQTHILELKQAYAGRERRTNVPEEEVEIGYLPKSEWFTKPFSKKRRAKSTPGWI